MIRLGYCHPGDVSGAFMKSVLDVYLATDLPLAYPPYSVLGGMNVWDHRNHIVDLFMEDDDEWLMFLDADMGLGVNGFRRLFDSADPDLAPVVGGLCFKLDPAGRSRDTQAMHYNTSPTIWKWGETPDGDIGYRRATDYSRDVLMPCDATGAACLIIHRSVLEKLGPKPFQPIYDHEAGLLSEDMSFCRRCNHAGIPIHVNTSVRTSHAKTFYVDERFHRSHTGRMGVPEILITGTGRCGTMYTAEALKHLGFAATHEQVWGVKGFEANPDIQIDCSWMLQEPRPQHLIHLVRNPLQVIGSFYRMDFPRNPDFAQFADFATSHGADIGGDRLESAVRWYMHWIEHVEDHNPDYVVRLEDWWDEMPELVSDLLDTKIVDGRLDWAIEQVPMNLNHRPGGEGLETPLWRDMVEIGGKRLRKIADRYGYKELNDGR